MIVDAVVQESIEFHANLEREKELNAGFKESITVNKDYNQLEHLPKLDGRIIKGDIPELDPTVPDWAKEKNKPQYNAEEVGAVDVNDTIPLDVIVSWFE